MANKIFRERLFLYLIGMATHSVGGVRGFGLFIILIIQLSFYQILLVLKFHHLTAF